MNESESSGRAEGSAAKLPQISIIIPAKNEERLIPSCLVSLQQQDYPRDRFEIIVVDNGSTDRTVVVSKGLADKVLECPGMTIGAMRNRGVQASSGRILGFIDADCLADPSWLKTIVEVLKAEHCLTGAECFIEDNAGWIAHTWCCLQQTKPTSVCCLATNNLVVPRDIFEKVGGFDEGLRTGEDCELCARCRQFVKVIADPRLRVIHRGVPKTLKQFFRREIWHGLGAWGTFRQDCFDKPLLATMGFALCLFGVIFGSLRLLLGGNGLLLALSLCGIVGLLMLSVYYRRDHVRSTLHAVRWGFLFSVFYLGRTIALLKFVIPKDFYHHMRN